MTNLFDMAKYIGLLILFSSIFGIGMATAIRFDDILIRSAAISFSTFGIYMMIIAIVDRYMRENQHG